MAASSSGASSSSAKRARICSKLLATTTSTKTALAKTLMALHKEGLLSDDIGAGSENVVRKSLTKRAQELAAGTTPYGPCIQDMPLGTMTWKFIHPMALIWLLSQVSSAFGDLMAQACQGIKELTIVVFVDEFRPGNVLRPDKGRGTQNILWMFTELPEWFICRADAWFQFGTLRSSLLEKHVPGGVSALMKAVTRTFFTGLQNFASGCVVTHGNESTLVRARFGGFLGDEKGMKEVFASKGPGGMKPCLTCKNIVQHLDGSITAASYLQGIAASRAQFDRATDEDIFAMVNRLRVIATTGSKADLERAEKAFGINYDPNSILFDRDLKGIVRPVTGWIRDWMHMLCVAGVGNIEVEQILNVLRHAGVPGSLVTTFFSNFTLPKQHGCIEEDWFTTKRMGKPGEERDGWKGFAKELLVIIPLLNLFLQTAVAPTADATMLRHVRCFGLLDKLVKLLSLGAEAAMAWMDLIRDTIDQHASLYSSLYSSAVKPKFHHLHHVIDGMQGAGRLLSCWVTERRHRSTKAFANHTFRHYEATLTLDTFNRMVVTAEEGHIYTPESIEDPVTLQHGGVTAACGNSAHLRCGSISKGDCVMLADRRVGFAHKFVSIEGQMGCLISLHLEVSAGTYAPVSTATVAVHVSSIVAACIWSKNERSLTVLPPPISATWD